MVTDEHTWDGALRDPRAGRFAGVNDEDGEPSAGPVTYDAALFRAVAMANDEHRRGRKSGGEE